MASPSPHHRHQSSLEGLIDFSPSTERLEPDQRANAMRIFSHIIDRYEPSQTKNGPYKRITLVRLTYEYALSEISRDNFLRYFFQYTAIPMEKDTHFEDWDTEQKSELESSLTAFADFLVDNFFLPLKASTRKTPQPSPAHMSDSQSTQQLVGTTQRVAALREDCLIRDRHRCVISRKFDDAEAGKRVGREGDDKAKDDDGHLLKYEAGTFAPLEVAHIIPHSLMNVSSGKTELNDSKKTALAILNMFDDGIIHLIEGSDIDRPRNALTLTLDLHQLFGNFEIFFEPTAQPPHSYRIDSTRSGIMRNPIFPLSRTLYLTTTRTIDPPSPRLLTVHRSITRILHLSAAGGYINRILEDLDKKDTTEDGSTELGHLVELRLGGWWNGQARVCC